MVSGAAVGIVIGTWGQQFGTGMGIIQAISIAMAQRVALAQQLIPDSISVNGQVRPLPRTWGFDR
jgi:hypothetical protein